MTTYHDYPRGTAGKTTCCGRPSAELPLGDGRTSDPKRVTCTGQFTPTVYAHEVYPHPNDGIDAGPLLDDLRYQLARTIALGGAEYGGGDFSRAYVERINLVVAERHVACLMVALAKGLTGQEAHAFAHAYAGDESGEVIYDFATEFGVELDRIKAYEVSE